MLTQAEKRFTEFGDALFPARIRLLRENMNKKILDESWVLFHCTLQLHVLVGHYQIPGAAMLWVRRPQQSRYSDSSITSEMTAESKLIPVRFSIGRAIRVCDSNHFACDWTQG